MEQYKKTNWEDRIVQYPNRYKDQDGNILELTQEPGEIAQEGTCVEAELMNNIENGLYQMSLKQMELEKLLEQAKELVGETVIDYTFEDNSLYSKEFDVNVGIDEILDIKIMGGASESQDVYFTVNSKDTGYYLMSRGWTGANTSDGTLSENAIFRSNKTAFYPFHTLKSDQSLIEGQLFLKYSPVQKKYYPNYKWECYTAIEGAQTYGGGYGWLNSPTTSITKIKFYVSSTKYFRAGTRIIVNKRKMTNYIESEVDTNLLVLSESNAVYQAYDEDDGYITWNSDNTINVTSSKGSWGVNITQENLILEAGKTYVFSCPNIGNGTYVSLDESSDMMLNSSTKSVEIIPEADTTISNIVVWFSMQASYDDTLFDIRLEEV